MNISDGNPVLFGSPDRGVLRQMQACLAARDGARGVLCADSHKGYAHPIGGVVAYPDAVSVSGVGFDIACGNLACCTDAPARDVQSRIETLMDDIFRRIAFGVGVVNPRPVDHELFEDPAWTLPVLTPLKQQARKQLGTVGGGNHYVDLFLDEQDRVWVGVHFGSRGLGHQIATAFLRAAGGRDGMDVPPALLEAASPSGQDYLTAMRLAGRYAFAGRKWVCERIIREILGAECIEEVHNHHNFAWRETHDGTEWWVIRKGATPAFPGQRGFVGGSMGDNAVILEGTDSEASRKALYSTVHGAGRVMSRTQAAGKVRWRHGRKERVTPGKISPEEMRRWVRNKGICLRGGGVDEAPQAYRRLTDVLTLHAGTIRILHELRPIGVAMAARDVVSLRG